MPPLAMPRPYKPRNSSYYWIRKAVPEELRPLVGTTELKRSLRTRDPIEAKRVAAVVLAEFEHILSQARAGQKFSLDDLKALAAEYYRTRKDELVKEAHKEHWPVERFDTEEFGLDLIRDMTPARIYANDNPDEHERAAILAWGMPRAESLLQSYGVVASPLFKERLAGELYKTELSAIKAARSAYRMVEHEQPEPTAVFRPPSSRTVSALFELCAKAKDYPSSTAEQWRKMIAHFDKWLDGKTADEVTPMDVQRYAEEVQNGKGLSRRKVTAKTVNESYLAAIRTVYNWAMKPGRELVKSNPAEGIAVDIPKHETGLKRRGYTREEVAQILSASRYQTTHYRRWVPWLLAFTGARVSEILNAKKADVGQTEGIWYINLREQGEGESGERLKNTWSVRCVPLHPALITEGFLDYYEALPDGEHLFPGKWKDKHGNRTKTPANRLREWINTLFPPDPSIAPNHSFRHWLIGECKRARIDPDYQRQLTGHSVKDVHGRYGPGDVPVLMESLRLIPSPLE